MNATSASFLINAMQIADVNAALGLKWAYKKNKRSIAPEKFNFGQFPHSLKHH